MGVSWVSDSNSLNSESLSWLHCNSFCVICAIQTKFDRYSNHFVAIYRQGILHMLLLQDSPFNFPQTLCLSSRLPQLARSFLACHSRGCAEVCCCVAYVYCSYSAADTFTMIVDMITTTPGLSSLLVRSRSLSVCCYIASLIYLRDFLSSYKHCRFRNPGELGTRLGNLLRGLRYRWMCAMFAGGHSVVPTALVFHNIMYTHCMDTTFDTIKFRTNT